MWTVIGENFVPGDAAAWHYCPLDLGENGFVLRVRGTSMTAPAEARHTFPEGTLLFVNPEIEAVPGKFVIVARNGNEATFKKLTIEEGELFLEALNPAWQPRYTRLEPDHHICGVVVFSGMPL
jgi:SOS-response transcriptional repressor LexA